MRQQGRERTTERAAERIRGLLAQKRLTKIRLASQIGSSRATMQRRLTGGAAFDLDELDAIAETLGVSVADLIEPTSVRTGERAA